MATVLDIDHEAGDLSEWDSEWDVNGDLNVTEAAGLAGTSYGLELTVDDSNAANVTDELGDTAYSHFRFRFYVDASGMSFSSGQSIRALLMTASAGGNQMFRVDLAYNAGATCQIQMAGQDDDSSWWNTTSSAYALTDEEHYIECYLERASDAEAEDGQATLWVDGTQRMQKTGWDNYNQMGAVNDFRAGIVGVVGSPSGTYYLDEFFANDTGAEIGPVEEEEEEAVSLLAMLGVG